MCEKNGISTDFGANGGDDGGGGDEDSVIINGKLSPTFQDINEHCKVHTSGSILKNGHICQLFNNDTEATIVDQQYNIYKDGGFFVGGEEVES